MAPRPSTKRKTSDIQEKSLKRTVSITSNITSTSTTTTTSTRRVSQPLAPSTSQNSIIKAPPKSKSRKPPQSSKPTSLPSTTTTQQHQPTPIPNDAPTTGSKLNVYVFGSGSMGELGLGPQSSQRNVKRPRLNTNLLPESVGVVDIAVGGMHCAAIDCEGRVWTWGVNDQGVLGRDTTWSPEEDVEMDSDDGEEDDDQLNPKESVPGLVEGFPEGTVISKIACGDSITVAVTSQGQVYAWGTFRVTTLSFFIN